MEAGLIERQSLRADLRLGLERCEFELNYQPILDLKSEHVCGFEALLRWRHPRLGMVAPDIFIPLAEETGLIVGIGSGCCAPPAPKPRPGRWASRWR